MSIHKNHGLGMYFRHTGAIPYSYYGQGSGLILMDDVTCSGGETRLLNCNHSRHGRSDILCNHYEDAGVRCLGVCPSVCECVCVCVSGACVVCMRTCCYICIYMHVSLGGMRIL